MIILTLIFKMSTLYDKTLGKIDTFSKKKMTAFRMFNADKVSIDSTLGVYSTRL